MKTIKVKVTKKHIQKGKRSEPTSCPIYHAMKDIGFKDHEVNGDGWGVSFINCNVKLPKMADDFIEAFDNGEPFKPFEFNIRVPNRLVPFPLLLPK